MCHRLCHEDLHLPPVPGVKPPLSVAAGPVHIAAMVGWLAPPARMLWSPSRQTGDYLPKVVVNLIHVKVVFRKGPGVGYRVGGGYLGSPGIPGECVT